MSSDEPDIDGRDHAALFEEAASIVPNYTDRWDPATDDAGTALMRVFARLAGDVTERLDRVPEKHRVSFFETLGFDRGPPQAATLPLTVTPSDGAERNVAIPAGTRAAAEGEAGEETFEIEPGEGFEATPASLVRFYGVDPEADRIFDHHGAVGGAERTRLFGGTDRQEHTLYLGHPDLLTLTPGDDLRVRLATAAPAYFVGTCLLWEYHGEEGSGDDANEGWHYLAPTRVEEVESPMEGRVLEVAFDVPGTATETAVGGTESLWLRCRANPHCVPDRLFDFEVGPLRLAVGMEAGADAISPDTMLRNDVPLADPSAADVASVAPFGDQPRRRDTFYLASEAAFTKPGATVNLSVELAESVTTDEPPEISWEYAAGNAWERLPILSEVTDEAAETLTGGGTVTFDVPADLTEATVAGHDGHWIRARLVGGSYGRVEYSRTTQTDNEGNVVSESWETETGGVTPPKLSSVRLTYEKREPPERALADNNLGLGGDLTRELPQGIRPFEGPPDGSQTLYFGFDRPLEDGPIQLLFSPTDRAYEPGFYPRIDWQYLADPEHGRWEPLSVQDGTESLLERGIVGLVFPERTTAHRRFGAERHWIRAVVQGAPFDVPDGPTGAADIPLRIVDVDASAETVTLRNDGDRPAELAGYRLDFEFDNPQAEQVEPLPAGTAVEPEGRLVVATGAAATRPADVTLDYERPVLNNLDPDAVAVLPPGPPAAPVALWRDERAVERPSERRPADLPVRIDDVDAPAETVTLRNDGDRPVELGGYLLDFEYGNPAATQVREFDPGTVVEPGGELVVATGTEATEPGDVTFDYERAVLNNLDPDAVAVLPPPESRETVVVWRAGERKGEPGKPEGQALDEEGPTPCSPQLTTRPPAGDPTRRPPVLTGVYPNTGWTRNVRSVDRETLGSSDGTQNQAFAVSQTPVVDEEVRVDELAALSEGARRDLAAARPKDVEAVTRPDGEPEAFWVQWRRVEDFLGSGPDDRHYTVDRIEGRVRFGDGRRGAIPPRGRGNVEASYRTGGGTGGNVEAAAVSGLESSIALVDEVTNPEPADGGADAEPTAAAIEDAAGQLRDRGRAVAAADFERIATSTTRKLARARCLPATGPAGERRPGWVTLVVVPSSRAAKPVPSASLRERVGEQVADRAPATVVDPEHLVVRGPSYVEASVRTTLVVDVAGSVAAVERAVETAISEFLHPLTGGADGTGWPFGELPCPSDLYALVEGVEGVDHATRVAITFLGSESETTVSGGNDAPSVAGDVLVYGGSHEVRAEGGE